GRYTTTATIEILPDRKVERYDPDTGKGTRFDVQETEITLNKAMEVSARVPVSLTEQELSGIKAQSVESLSDSSKGVGATMGAPLIEEVMLITGPDKSGVFTVLPSSQFTANMSATDGRMVDIIYTGDMMNTVKNQTIKNVRLAILPVDPGAGADGSAGSGPDRGSFIENKGVTTWKPWKGYVNSSDPVADNLRNYDPAAAGGWIISDRAFSIKVVETWPKVTLAMEGNLSLAFPGQAARITATTPVGIGEVTAMGLNVPAMTITIENAVATTPAGGAVNFQVKGNVAVAKPDLDTSGLPKNRKVTLTAKTGSTNSIPAGGWVKIEGYRYMFLPDNGLSGSKAVEKPEIMSYPKDGPPVAIEVGSLQGSSLKAAGLPALTVTVDAANALPKAKLSKGTVPILTRQNARSDRAGGRIFEGSEYGPAYVQILSGDKKVSNAALWAQIDRVEIRGMTAKNGAVQQGPVNLKATYVGGGRVRLDETEYGVKRDGTSQMSMNVYFKGVIKTGVLSELPLAIDFKISAPAASALKPVTKAQTVNVSVKPVADYLASKERIEAWIADPENEALALTAAEKAAMDAYDSLSDTYRLATIPVAINVDNLALGSLGIASVGGTLQIAADNKTMSNKAPWGRYIGNQGGSPSGGTGFAVDVRPGAAPNTIELWADKAKLKEFVAAHNEAVGPKNSAKTNMKFTLMISDARPGAVPGATLDSRFRDSKNKLQAVGITLNLIKDAPGFSVSLAKQRLDITNPDGFQGATVKLTNVASEIKYVKLYEQRFSDAKKKVLCDLGNMESRDFETVVTGPLEFQIVKKPGALPPPNVGQKLSVEVGLKNGQVLRSWVYDGKKLWTDKPITVNPQQPGYKATYSRNNVTMHRSAPLSGEAVGLRLTPTATNPDVMIGAVSIDPASVKLLEDGGFRLEQSGEGEWTIYFANDRTPKVVDKNGKVQLKNGLPVAPNASYKVGMQIWPEGAYKWQTDPRQPDGLARDKSGNRVPVALTNPANGKAASKPVTVNVTVKIQ
ncbi:MAG: hypothetical protein FWG03_00005, partial [Clostridiales bacterium]|nr:hypothetical protein [Clostridiales bacterium]